MKIFVKYLPGTEELYYKTEGSACADLRYFDADGSMPELAIMPGETVMIHTGVSMWINDPKFTALVFPRSGLGSKGLVLANTVGVIDSDYQGEIMLALKNAGQSMLKIAAGDRIAQVGIFHIVQPVFYKVKEFPETTWRGKGGFGSTGTK